MSSSANASSDSDFDNLPTTPEEIYWEINVVLTSVILAFVISASFQLHFLEQNTGVLTPEGILLLAIYGLIIWSQIGYLRSVSKTPYKRPWRFMPDFVILLLYGYMTWNIERFRIVEMTMVLIFVGYLLWDLLKLYYWWEKYGWSGSYRAGITFVFVIASTWVWTRESFGIPLITEPTYPAWWWAFLQVLLLSLFWVAKSEYLKDTVWEPIFER